jgi:SprT protein
MKIELFFFYSGMIKKIALASYVPHAAVMYCEHLYQNNNFIFHFSRPRRTRLGDFTVKPGFTPKITVNVNLNSYNFLITFLHEVAHYVVYQKYRGVSRRQIAPHGPEWKREFYCLLQPVMNEDVFPRDILLPLNKYAINPKASTGADQVLYNAIKKYDDPSVSINKTALIHLNEGTDFVFQNRVFVRGSVRRTRVLCTDKVSQRRYTIPAHALVEACY